MQIIENAVYMGAATPGQGGGSAPVIDELNVTPTTSAQTITAPSGTDGYSPVNVAAVTSAIDANIVAGNIKKDVEILGVTGSYEGQTPTGTKSITANGVYDVTDFASADVQVPTTAPAHYVEKTVVDGQLRSSTNIINLNGVTDVGNAALAYAYAYMSFPANSSADLSSLTTISGNDACIRMFNGCTGLKSVDLSGLTTISGTNACQYFVSGSRVTNVNLSSLTTISGSYGCSYFAGGFSTGYLQTVNLDSLTTISGDNACNNMFALCQYLASINLPALRTISGSSACQNMFSHCALTSIDLPSLTTISGSNACSSMFNNCYGLITAKFNTLNSMTQQIAPSYAQMFQGCSKLESVEFGGLKASTFASRKDQIAYLFNTTTGSQATNGCTVHFPSNFDPSDPNHTFDASTLTGYPTFGGNASYIHVAFDLPATE